MQRRFVFNRTEFECNVNYTITALALNDKGVVTSTSLPQTLKLNCIAYVSAASLMDCTC